VANVLKNVMPKVPILLFSIYKEAVGHSHARASGIKMVLTKPEDYLALPR
jgi:hypothetical protein